MENSKLVRFVNCKIIKNHRIIEEDLWVRNGVVVDYERILYIEKKMEDEVVDLEGNLVAPGLIDIQINGGFGVDFTYNVDELEKALRKVSSELPGTGVTAFCPTIVTSKPHVYRKVTGRSWMETCCEDGATVLGFHLEGPFISRNMKGAHSEECIADLDRGINSLYDVYGNLGGVSLVTLAPEKKNALLAIECLRKEGVAVALGHTDSDFATGLAALDKGATLITHLFNAMKPFHHREPGPIGLLVTRRPFYTVISDGIHLHSAAVLLAYKVHPEGLILVTDAMAALGLPEGEYHLGKNKVRVKGKLAYISETSTLAGTVSPLIDCVRNFMKITSCGLVEAIEAASLKPALLLGIHNKKGTLLPYADADFIVLDDHLNLISTWIAGQCVFSSS